jgi:hypothetical protein
MGKAQEQVHAKPIIKKSSFSLGDTHTHWCVDM